MFLKNLFSSEPVNTGRQKEIDHLKGWWILGMVVIHVFEEISSVEYGGAFGTILFLFGAPYGAAGFMLAMGIGICYAEKATAEGLIKRGCSLFIVNLLLNLFRTTLPEIFMSTGKSISFDVAQFFESDILAFAALAMIAIGLLKKIKLSEGRIFLVSIVMSVLAMFLRGVQTDIWPVDVVLGHFWGITHNPKVIEEETIWFPLMNWLIFPAAGMYLATFLKRCTDVHKLFARLTLPCFLGSLVYFLAELHFGWGMGAGDDANLFGDMRNFYLLHTLDALVCIIGAVGFFGVVHFLLRLFPRFEFQIFNKAGRCLNEIYCISWILLGWLTNLLVYLKVDDKVTWQWSLLASAVIMPASYYLSNYLKSSRKNRSLTHY